MMSGGTTSGRVESSCPNLTNVGPSSSSISRRWRPRTVAVSDDGARRPSSTNPNPWRTATWAISPSRPMLAVFDGAMRSVLHASRACPCAPLLVSGGTRLGAVVPGRGPPEQAPGGVERLDLVHRDPVRLGALAAELLRPQLRSGE